MQKKLHLRAWLASSYLWAFRISLLLIKFTLLKNNNKQCYNMLLYINNGRIVSLQLLVASSILLIPRLKYRYVLLIFVFIIISTYLIDRSMPHKGPRFIENYLICSSSWMNIRQKHYWFRLYLNTAFPGRDPLISGSQKINKIIH